VPGQLAAHADVALAGLQVVDGADVVQASARHVVPGGGVGARHHPGGAQRDGMDLAGTRGDQYNAGSKVPGPRRRARWLSSLAHRPRGQYGF